MKKYVENILERSKTKLLLLFLLLQLLLLISWQIVVIIAPLIVTTIDVLCPFVTGQWVQLGGTYFENKINIL